MSEKSLIAQQIIQPKLVMLSRRVSPHLYKFLKAYNKFVEFIQLVTSGKYEGNAQEEFTNLVEQIQGMRPKIKKYVDNSTFIEFGRFANRLLRSDILSEDISKIKNSAVFRLNMIRVTRVLTSMVEAVIAAVVPEGKDYSVRTRRFKGIPVNFYKMKTQKEIQMEQQDQKISEEIARIDNIKKVNENKAEEKALDNGQVLDRARIMGKVVQIGMAPEDSDSMKEALKEFDKEKEVLSKQKSGISKNVKRLRARRNKVAKSDIENKEQLLNEIDSEIFSRKEQIAGKFTGGWEDDGGNSGKWELVREFGRVPGLTAQEYEVDPKLKGVVGGWSAKGVDLDNPNKIYRLLVNKKGVVKGRDLPIVGRLYLEGKNINGWIRVEAKRRVNFKQGSMKEQGLDQKLAVTKEKMNDIRDTFDRYVYTPEGEVVPMHDWMKDTVQEKREQQGLENVHKIEKHMKKYEDQMVEEGLVDKIIEEGAGIQWLALTDDKVPKNVALTKMFPVVKIGERDVVADGEFKGVPLDVLVNQADRLIKGTSFVVTEGSGLQKMEMKKETGEMEYLVQSEPYVTVSGKGDLMIVLPKTTKNIKSNPIYKVIQEIAKYSQTVRSLMKPGDEEYSVRTIVPVSTFIISPQDLDDIKDRIGSLSMSSRAAAIMKKYYDKRRETKEALLEEQYGDILPETVEGFKKIYVDDEGNEKPFEFRSFQKKAISLLAKKGNGLCGLDTGCGKSVVSIATLLTYIKDGTLDKNGKNGKALYVVPASLRGNIPAEIRKFCENPDDVLKYIDIMSYDDFRETDNSEIEKYGTVFFDEAQALKNAIGKGASKVGKKALKLNHPHKVLLTASVLEKSPADLYNLVMIADNTYNVDEEKATRNRNEFLRETCEMVGGRPVAVKQTQSSIDRMRDWVKANALYVDKREVAEEINLPPVTDPADQPVAIQMASKQEMLYSEVADDMKATLKTMKDKYYNKELTIAQIKNEVTKSNIMDNIIRLREISNDPELYVKKHEARRLAKEKYGKTIGELTTEEKKAIDKEVNSVVEKMDSPKIERCKQSVGAKIARGKRVAVWTDQPSFALKTGIELSLDFPGKYIAVCLSDRIDIFTSDGKVSNYDGSSVGRVCVPVEVSEKEKCIGKASFRASTKYLYPNGEKVPKKQWQKYIMDYVLASDANISVVVLTSAYATGHNLQWCSSVIHMDRDSWNNEMMKQRTARCWRQGQKDPVDVEILDSVVSTEEQEFAAINEIQRWMMEMEEDLFDKVVRESISSELNTNLVQFGTAQEIIGSRSKSIDPRNMVYIQNPSVQAESNMVGQDVGVK